MMTPCREAVIAAFLAAAWTATGTSGDSPASGETSAALFSASQDAILSAPSGSLAIGGRVICVGRAKSPVELGNAVGEERARAMAKARFLDFIRDASPWPEDAPGEDRALAWPLLLSESEFSIEDVPAEQVFFDSPGEGLFLVVLAFPEEAALAARPSATILADAVKRIRALRAEVERERLTMATVSSGNSSTNVPSAPPPASGRLDALRRDILDWTEPRGIFESHGIIANETMSDSLL